MNRYRVRFYPDVTEDLIELFECEAEGFLDAEAQCMNAHPGAIVDLIQEFAAHEQDTQPDPGEGIQAPE